MLNRRHVLLGLAALAAGPSCSRPNPPLFRAAEWLWTQCDPESGLFGSHTVGLLASGQSLTPFALLALAEVPEVFRPERAGRALATCLASLDEGALGFRSSAPDYPTYATALLLSALARLRPQHLGVEGRPLADWLLRTQFGPEWAGHPAEGGFGMGSKDRPKPPDSGHVDLSMTRRALQALAEFGAPAPGAALAFVSRCQTADGSFLYSPVEMALNKGERSEDSSAGYGSATTDGVLALAACGLPDGDPKIVKALDYLRRVHRVDRNPGVPEAMGDFATAMRGYYRAGAAQVFGRFGGPAGWQSALRDAVLAEQKPDGSWQNESPLQKENDPIVATSFAILALAACER